MAGPTSLSAHVMAFIRKHRLIGAEQPIRVGFSGGADSTALTLLLDDAFPHVEAVHLNHHLRGDDAATDAAWCAEFCRQRGIAYTVTDLDVTADRRPGEGIEEAGRRLRLDYWRQTTDRASVVALGHHADDCIEDLLLRLARGAGAGGLASMRPARDLGGVRVVRPLLDVRRTDVEHFLREHGIKDWRRDASNDDATFRRNAVRHQWLPLMLQTVGHDTGLLRSLEALRDDADCLHDIACRSVHAVESVSTLQALPAALLPRVLRCWLSRRSGRDMIPSRDAILRLRTELERFAGHPRLIPLEGTLSLRLDNRGLHLVAEHPPLLARTWAWRREAILPLPDIGKVLQAKPIASLPAPVEESQPDGEIFLAHALADVLVVRGWQHGDRMVPFGRRSEVKLQDLFSDAKIPREERCRLPVIVSAGRIVWVPGLRRSECGRAHPGDEAIHLCCTPLPTPADPCSEFP